jgi:stage II sporulation protein D
LIQTRREDGSFLSTPVETIGELLDIEIEERKPGGIVTSVILVGSERSVRVRSEYNIRLLLAPINDVINRKDGSQVNGFGMMPSAFFVIDKMDAAGSTDATDSTGLNFTFTGGGYGHGVGMSQNGVKAMANIGKGFEEILGHYYSGTKVGVLY